MELSSTAHGVYNLGFLAVNRSDEAQNFLNWWAERLYLYCYDDIQRGVFTDQKWIDLAPCFFDVEIFKHRGYDFGTWSLLNCDMTQIDGKIFIKGDPLRFIHFSGYGETLCKCINDWLPTDNHPFKELYAKYSKNHDENDSDGISRTTWSYAAYSSGEKIDDTIRKKYRADYDLMFSVENPFELSNRYFRRKTNIVSFIGRIRQYILKAFFILKSRGFWGLCRKIQCKIKENLAIRLNHQKKVR